MTIWFEPCLRISGSETPSLSIRFRMMSIERLRSSGVSLWPFGGTAFRTTSRPPCRSRPSVGFLWTGEPGTAKKATPTSGREDAADEDEVTYGGRSSGISAEG